MSLVNLLHLPALALLGALSTEPTTVDLETRAAVTADSTDATALRDDESEEHRRRRSSRCGRSHGGTPEPGTMLLLGGAAASYLGVRRRKQNVLDMITGD